MPQIKYIDLHCDTVTRCCDAGGDICGFDGQVNLEKLKKSGCMAQCFAIFTNGKNAAADFEKYAAFYNAAINTGELYPVRRFSDFARAEASSKTGALLTVENLGFLKGNVKGVEYLSALGVTMASLVWNEANAYAYPNLVVNCGRPDLSLREPRGLTPLGKETVEALDEKKIILDVSHLSDGGVADVLQISRAPIVAGHSNAAGVFFHPRNLTDGQIKAIADKGGVIGLNFSKTFLGGGSAFSGLYEHFSHIINTGGEDSVAIGSDFDGIEPYFELKDCTRVGALLDYFYRRGAPVRVLEKLAYKNFMRVFKSVHG